MADMTLFGSAKTNEWTTPEWLFRELDTEFHFTLDPCCTHESAKCSKHFTAEDDGLRQDWTGERVFCNPPYSEVKAWVEKAHIERALTVMLIFAKTDTKWFHEYIYQKREIRFLRGRLTFGSGNNSAPFPSMLVIFDNLAEEWRDLLTASELRRVE